MAATVRKKSPPNVKKSANKARQGNSSFDYKWIGLACILILTAIVFSPGISKDFVSLDDPAYVKDNPFIKSLSWDSISKIFSSFYNANYHPVTTLVYAIEYKFFKLDATPYHLINLLIHLANVCLVFILIEKISNRKEIALIAALLFGIHPLHVESVAWVSELKDVLFSFFLIAALIVYTKRIRLTVDSSRFTAIPKSASAVAVNSETSTVNSKRNKLLFYTLVLFLLSLLSKPAAVIFPLLLILFDYYYKRGWSKEVILEKIPFFLLAMAFGIITIFSQKSAGAINADYMVPYSAFQRIFVVSYGLVFYIVKLFLPINLCSFYYAPKVIPSYYYACPFVIAAIAWMVVKAKVMKQELIFGFLFYVFSILLVVQIIPVGYAVVSERYSYIPYIGLFFIAGSFYVNVIENKFSFSSNLKSSIGYIIVGFVLFFSITSFQRTKTWRNSLSLFTDISEKNPGSAYALFGLGKIQNEVGDYSAALATYTHSVELDSTIAEVYFYRGNTYYTQKNLPMALKDYLKAVQVKPDYVEDLNNVGTVYSSQGKYDDAISYFSKAISIRPNQYLYRSRGTSYYFLKKYSEAVADYDRALAIDSGLTEAYFNRGVSQFYLQHNAQACDDWKKAASMNYDKAAELIRAYCK